MTDEDTPSCARCCDMRLELYIKRERECPNVSCHRCSGMTEQHIEVEVHKLHAVTIEAMFNALSARGVTVTIGNR